ncbi:MAG TPA: dTDP-4-dehydrorhamnose reductase [Vicinamibacteria bacterium]|nr:dTDP-4-dehydrorhamnose reductase [Vicinamibacteria bacterium]
MRILLTGAGGQLGRALQSQLSRHQLTALDRGRLDITRLEAVRQALGSVAPELVLNAAAYNAVDRAESDPEAAFRVNALGPRNLALAAAEAGAAILHVSSDYVFDGESQRPYHEFDPTRPLSAYGLSKLAGELAVKELNPRHYLVRTAWLYAVGGKNFAHSILEAARRSAEVRVVDDQSGSPTFVPHLARAMAGLIETGAFGTYHLAGSGGTSWHGLTRRLFDALQVRTPLRAVTTADFPRPARRPAYSILTTWQDPQIRLPPWEDGVSEFAEELKAR